MSQATDFTISNQSFPDFRTDLNSVLGAINTMNSGTSRPSSAVAGTMWLDTTSASSPTIKFFDGSDDISFATIDYSANTVNFLDSTVVADIVGDTSPQLGGQLDVNGNAIGDGVRELIKFIETASAVNEVTVTNSATGNPPEISATGDDTNIDLKLTPKGSGKLNLDGIKFPNADGTANQALITDGSGNLSFGAVSGGTSWQSAEKTANFTAVAGEGYFVNTSGGAFEIDLPSSPSVGDEIEFVDSRRNFATANLTLDPQSNNFQGNTSPKPVYDVAGQSIKIVYSGSTQGWIPVRDDDVTLETPQTVSAEYLVVAGGGSGGTGDAAGAGAGGFLTNFGGTAIELNKTSVYTVTVGGGGAGVTGSPKTHGNDGSNSSLSGTGITTITSIGGGGGGSSVGPPNSTGNDGGSGGGAGTNGTAGSGTTGQGNDGGSNSNGGAGGGGAGEAGDTDGESQGGDGLSNSITGSAVFYAGGGGGSNGSVPNAAGGDGGGTTGVVNPNSSSSSPANTGGGSGGANDQPSGNGGSGVVILRVLTSDFTGTTSGSPTVTTDGSHKVIKFTASGSYTA
tara:strand:+ start:164 stop:1864 length:1701 start_codon:yes stop_codon:yes gene_type:complete